MSYQIEKLKNIALIKTGKLDSNAAVTDGAYPFFTCDPNTLKIDGWAYDTEAVLLAGNNASGNYTAKYYKGKFNAYQRTYIIESANTSLLTVRFLAFAITEQLRLLKSMSSGSTTKFLTMCACSLQALGPVTVWAATSITTSLLSKTDCIIKSA